MSTAHMRAGALNLLVFREERCHAGGAELKAALARELGLLHGSRSPDEFMNVLLRAGELECAIADARNSNIPVQPYMSVTDRLAEGLMAPGSPCDTQTIRKVLAEAAAPERVQVSPAEGFAYYALHPLAYADVLHNIPSLPATLVVIGVRSIGTTLSAVTAAAARARGKRAERITVRPAGHPYNRRTQLAPGQIEFIQRYAACGAVFLILDEGPGLSGSSFISVAEAFVEAGAPREKIILVCGHEPDIDSLRVDDGPRRARQFQWIAVPPEPRLPPEAGIFIGGGEWRRRMFPDRGEWPASWISFERLKYLSSAEGGPRKIFKFAGLGHYGDRVIEREEKVAVAGFGVASCRERLGFASYPWIAGRPMSGEDLSPRVLARLAAYCAFRAEAFATELSGLDALQQMAEHNFQELGFEAPVRLRTERPVLADGRMQPHEWLLGPDGRMLKTDSGSHGNDHFFPGATDIAWDLAGAIVEWQMNDSASAALLEAYRQASGDDARPRIADFVTAYTVFRCAYCLMAANALQGSEEQARLERAAADYGGRVIPAGVPYC
jgi:hypothetical protein